MTKSILLIAFDSIPSTAVSTQRTMAMFNHLNELGWTTILLTTSENCYLSTAKKDTLTLKSNQYIYRASAFNIKNKFSFNGKYFGPLATPDQFSPWIFSACILGRKILKEHSVDVILSTYPIPSAHVIAATLSRMYQKPWVADYRDPAPYIHTTNGKWLDMVHRKIDEFTLKHSKKMIFTTEESKKIYETAFGLHNNFSVIGNGYDELMFYKAYSLLRSSSQVKQDKFILYYCGSLYSNGRSPNNVLQSLAKLKSKKTIDSNNFQLIFQGNLEPSDYSTIIQELNIEDLIQFKQPTSQLNCIVNMLKSNMLLIIQGARFNIHIPAKMYECLKANKPILLIAPSESAVANLANQFEQCKISENIDLICEFISSSISSKNKVLLSEPHKFEKYSRKFQINKLHQLLLPLIT